MGESDTAASVLKWYPGSGQKPSPRILVGRFNNNDLGIEGPGLGRFWQFGALVEYFCGDDQKLREQFQVDFSKYLAQNHDGLHPNYDQPASPNVDVYTYRKAYEFDQPVFLEWLKKNNIDKDLFEPAARKYNGYRGSLLPPYVQSADQVTDDFLNKTFGYAIYPQGDCLVMLIDNKHNPSRWIAPVNEVHHHEQSSMGMTIPAKPGQWDKTATIFKEYFEGKTNQRILLDYNIEFSVEDMRYEMNEFTIWDYYGGPKPFKEPEGIISQVHHNTFKACMGEAFKGATFTKPQQRSNLSWAEKRLINIGFQASIMVNFIEKEGCYRLAEFMLCGKGQQPHMWNYTKAEQLNSFGIDGGISGPMGWHRASVDMLSDERFTSVAPDKPVAIDCDKYIEIPDAGLKKASVKGTIDLTNYYVISKKQGWFPGQSGKLDGEWVGFEGDDPRYFNPDEAHGIQWLGFVFENHAPFKVTFKIKTYTIRLTD
jgi:hypothetical protein